MNSHCRRYRLAGASLRRIRLNKVQGITGAARYTPTGFLVFVSQYILGMSAYGVPVLCVLEGPMPGGAGCVRRESEGFPDSGAHRGKWKTGGCPFWQRGGLGGDTFAVFAWVQGSHCKDRRPVRCRSATVMGQRVSTRHPSGTGRQDPCSRRVRRRDRSGATLPRQ